MTITSSSIGQLTSFEWFPTMILLILFLCFIFLLILIITRIRHYNLRRKTNLYEKCSQLTVKPTNRLPIETHPNQIHIRSNYDDITSMGSYIYPITSTTSLIHTSSPSSLFKNDQYTMINTNNVEKNLKIRIQNSAFCVFRRIIMRHQTSHKVIFDR